MDCPKKRWLIGSNFVGMLCEVRVWKGNRSTLDIQRDMNRTLTGKEPGLAAYYKVNEGFGHTVYDWCGDHNGWISRSIHPSWRLCDVPIISSCREASAVPGRSGDKGECWPIFLPSVKDAFFYTNGVELGVVVPKVCLPPIPSCHGPHHDSSFELPRAPAASLAMLRPRPPPNGARSATTVYRR